ncbi:MAG TPA: hypothetical protein VEA58_07615 [Anaerovoracaceae bacterium]|nr:hypothetical protein [Anaerovoracaceae bacterium]
MRKILVLVLSLIITFMLSNCNGTKASEEPNQVQLGNEEDAFYSQNYEYINMFGNPQFWDDEKNMDVDINGDGEYENFTISRDLKDGIRIEVRAKQNGNWKSMNFWAYNVYELLRTHGKMQTQTIKAKNFITWDISGLLSLLKEGSYIVEGSGIVDDDYTQISCCDIDEDGVKEVLVSVGNKQNENITAIYQYSEVGETPFTYCGYISCDTFVRYIGNKIILAYRGNLVDNLYDRYIYEGEEVRKLATKKEHRN